MRMESDSVRDRKLFNVLLEFGKRLIIIIIIISFKYTANTFGPVSITSIRKLIFIAY